MILVSPLFPSVSACPDNRDLKWGGGKGEVDFHV